MKLSPQTPEGHFNQGSRSGVPKMLLSKGHLTGRALDSNPKARMCRPEIRFHQVPVQCFPSARPLLQCQVSGRWVGCPEHRAGGCLLLSRSQLFGSASGLIRGQLRPSECAATAELEKIVVPAVALPRSWEGQAAGEPFLPGAEECCSCRVQLNYAKPSPSI